MPTPRVIQAREPRPSWIERALGRLLGSKLRKAAWAAVLLVALFGSDCAEHFEHILGDRVVPAWVTAFGRGTPEVVDVRVARVVAEGQKATFTLEIATRTRLTSKVVVDCALVDRRGGQTQALRRTLHAAGVGGAIEPGRPYPLEIVLMLGGLRGARDGEIWLDETPMSLRCAATRAR